MTVHSMQFIALRAHFFNRMYALACALHGFTRIVHRVGVIVDAVPAYTYCNSRSCIINLLTLSLTTTAAATAATAVATTECANARAAAVHTE
jgi:hypothetical protein